MNRQSLVRNRSPFRAFELRKHSAAHVSLSSIFNFQRTDTTDAVSWAYPLLASGPVECRSRGSLDFVQLSRNLEANFSVAGSVAAVVGEAYIVGAPSDCQHRFRTFLKFLRRRGEPSRFALIDGRNCGARNPPRSSFRDADMRDGCLLRNRPARFPYMATPLVGCNAGCAGPSHIQAEFPP